MNSGRKAKQQAIPSQLSWGSSLDKGTQVEVTRIVSVYSSGSTRPLERQTGLLEFLFGPGGLLTWNTNIFLRTKPTQMKCHWDSVIGTNDTKPNDFLG